MHEGYQVSGALTEAADRLDHLAAEATEGPWWTEANSMINVLPGGQAEEFTSWSVHSPAADDETPTTMLAGPERDPLTGGLTGGIWAEDDARYIAAMCPLIGKKVAMILRAIESGDATALAEHANDIAWKINGSET